MCLYQTPILNSYFCKDCVQRPTRDGTSPTPGVGIVVAVSTLLGVSQNAHRTKLPSFVTAKLELQTLCCQFHWPSPPPCSSFHAISFFVRPSASSGLLPSHEAAVNDKHPAFSIQTRTGILSAFGKPPAHPQALAVSKLCRFLSEHSCLPYALDCMGKPDPLPQPELTGSILEILPIKQPYKRKQQANFLGMQEAWTTIPSQMPVQGFH